MKAVLEALNRLVEERVIEDYAIGGAIGASFYVEAINTEDVDAFVLLPVSAGPLVLLGPVYEALGRYGGIVEGQYVRFGDWPLQILTDSNPLIAEAIRTALAVDFDGLMTRVFRLEYLCAVALQTGRRKDYSRVSMFLEQQAVNTAVLADLAEQYGLKNQMARAQI